MAKPIKFNRRKERINGEITSDIVRITGKGIESSEVPIEEALRIASDMDVDLVEIVTGKAIPVCRLIDYSKLVYERKLKQKDNSQKNKKGKVKELRFTYNTAEHDFNFKLNHAINFLKKGDKVKAYVMFKGREINFKDMGEILLLKFITELREYGKVESLPKLEGRKMIVTVSPL